MKKPSYCPDWFDISNYDACASYSREAWSNSLILRFFEWRGMSKSDKDRPSFEYRRDLILFATQKKTIEIPSGRNYGDEHYSPLESIVDDASLFSFFDCYESISNDAPQLIEAIQKAADDANHANEVATPEERRQIGHISWCDVSDIECHGVTVHTKLTERLLVGDRADGLVEVSLSESDDRIIKAFTAWLARKRVEQGYGPKDNRTISDAEISKWHGLRILAYIDLVLWGDLIGKPFTFAQLGNLLYPDEVDIDVTERVRKVVAPKVETLFRNGVRGLI